LLFIEHLPVIVVDLCGMWASRGLLARSFNSRVGQSRYVHVAKGKEISEVARGYTPGAYEADIEFCHVCITYPFPGWSHFK
jgi:hypothetical protein